jgi:L-ornithine N5-oxygenase
MGNDGSNDPVDIVGIGFGPANLALAIAIEEHNRVCAPDQRLTARFIERQERFGWHRGMLLEGTTMQVAFPKDLVTLRNPTSEYSFFAYLHDRNRLIDFVNHQTFFPTRREFHDYLEWAAGRVDADVRYGRSVTSVQPGERTDGRTDQLVVEVDDGSRIVARNVVVGVGLQECIPSWATRSPRCFHNHSFLPRIAELPEVRHNRFVVLGAGQSAAEVVQYLYRAFPHAEVHSVFARWGYSPADDSPYANRIFDPATVDELHRAPAGERARLLALHRGTNYSVVDLELINELYAWEYQERVNGARRLFMRRASEVVEVADAEDGIEVGVRSMIDGLTDTLMCDALVLATGFRPLSLKPLLGDLVPDDRREVLRDYRVPTAPDVTAGVYLQGGTEHTHGLTSSLLSNVSVRAGEVLASVVARRGVNDSLARVEQSERRTMKTVSIPVR